MFEAAKLGRKVSKEAFKAEVPELRYELLKAQRALRGTDTAVVVIISGVEGAGKGEVVNRLNEWLDTRGMQTFAFWDETDEERERPRYWRFWRTLPERGEISILFGGWYMDPINHRMRDRCTDVEVDAELNRIADFERMLTEDGALVVKFWFHLPEEVEKKRLKKLSRDDRSRWKMNPKKGRFSDHYEQFEKVAERIIRHTDTGISPWYLIEATDTRYRDLTVGRTLLEAINARLEAPRVEQCATTVSQAPHLPVDPGAQLTVLDKMDLSQSLERDIYKRELKKLQSELNLLAWEAYQKKRSCVLVFEGVDAGGKGGAIRRLTNAIDSRLYRTIPVAAPTDEEKAHHYLWRFWRHIPRAGRLTVYDRSWYGRVLVERVEGFASDDEWKRAYSEINEFEEQLVESGIVVLKFWLQISQDEQLARFKAREETPYKQHKITDEDWRNREKWSEYKQAVNEMVVRTSTEYSPWTLVPGNDKPFARIQVLRTVRDRLKAALKEENGRHLSPCKAIK
ncbi:MAG TPA: polyphosphate:AMP phosphotransferase [Sedimenticola sp.]|nr:polyphosphate:AMP phosphotransferase [Sedimenticola sp.]